MTGTAFIWAWALAALSGDTVVIAVQPPDDRAAFEIIDACNRALGGLRCRLPESAAPTQTPDSQPTPTGEGVPATTRVRVALRDPEVSQASLAFDARGLITATRVLAFKSSDPAVERYRAIGLVVAARLLEEDALRRGEPPKAPTAAPRTPEPRVGLETGAALSEGLDDAPLRIGLRSRLSLQPLAALPISALLSFRLAGAADDPPHAPSMRWTSVGLGLLGSVPLGGRLFAIELHAEAALQWASAELRDRSTGQTDSGLARRLGVLSGLQLTFRPVPRWMLFAGGEASVFFKPLRIEVHREPAAKEDPLRLSALLGQRILF